jgi:hypothetical protein
MQTPGAGRLGAVSCASATACVAIGTTPTATALTESWNGATWTTQPGATNGTLSAVSCVSGETCVAAGRDQSDDIVAERWDGTSWTALPLPEPQQNAVPPWSTAVSCSAENACTVVGTNEFIQSQFKSYLGALVFHWNGAAWSTQTIQLPRGEGVSTIGGVACPTANSCTLVGSYSFFEGNGPQLTAPLLEHWDGATWSSQQPPPQSIGPVLNGVSCPSITTCIAVGQRAFIMPDGNRNTGSLQTVPYILSDS